MKKIMTVCAISALLVGCGTKTVVVERTTTTDAGVQQTAPERNDTQYGVDNYINNVVAKYPGLINSLGRNWLVQYANTTCESIDDGLTLTGLAEMALGYNLDVEMIGFLTGEAIRNFCPRNQWFIDAAAQA